MKRPILLLLVVFVHLSSQAQVITTFAGTGASGYSGDGGPATAAKINVPFGTAVDGAGNVYICDPGNYRIRKIDPAGIISTIAGNGTFGFSGDGGPATAAMIAGPCFPFIDAAGNFYFCDQGYDVVRKISTSGIITTIAGIPDGSFGYAGDGGPATAARMWNPRGLFIDALNNIFITDRNNRIRKVDASGTITTFAGTGVSGYSGDGGPASAATFNPAGPVTGDALGNIYISDGNYVIRKVDLAGIITTIAGTAGMSGLSGDGGPASAARFSGTGSPVFDGGGNLYITDGSRIRMINSSMVINTVAGTTTGYSGDGGSPLAAQLNFPSHITFDGGGNMYISDYVNYRIRKICNPPSPATLSGTTSVLCASATTTLTASIGGGTWSTATGNASVSGSAGLSTTVTGVSAGVDTVRYILTNSCYFSKSEWPVTINAIPTVSAITGTATVCPGSSTVLTVTTGGGVWSSVSPSFATVDAAGNVSGIGAGTSIINYTVTNGCGSDVASAVVTVNPLPAAGSITGVSSVCVGSSTALTDPATGGVWSSVFPSFATVDAAGSVAGLSTGTDTIKYTVTNSCGTDVARFVITVNTTPTPVIISGISPICISRADTLTSTGSGGTWSSSDATTATIGTASGIALGHATGLAIISYTQTDACGTVSTAFPLTVIGPPVVGAISGVSSMCVSAIFTLVSPDTGGTWSSTNLSVAFMDTAGNIYGAGAGGTTISYTKTNSCGASAALHTVTVLGIPHVSLITGPDTVCADGAIVLHDSVSGGVWTTGNARVIISADTIKGHITGIDTIGYSITNMCGADTARKVVVVIPPCDSSAFSATPRANPNYFSVTPNPAHNLVTLEMRYGTNDNVTGVITNTLGQTISHFSMVANRPTEMPMNVAPGVYIITATIDGERYSAKVVVE